ncbi:hypothetical protein ACFC26_12450 [Kitasatospora purpeofusca]|uniref:hypothetical protein n=1 Tax=Kitasatospora purpeofusca TaxID=67352 RepID=UPI0035E28F81
MPVRPAAAPGTVSGAGRVTLSRTGGGAGPDWGAYALFFTTRPAGEGTEAVIGYCAPDDPLLDPAWGLHQEQPYGPAGIARRPLGDYAAAANAARGRSESPSAYDQRLALYLLRIAAATRLVHFPRIADLPWADCTLTTEQHVRLVLDPDHPTRGWAGCHQVRVGRLLILQPKNP